MTNYPLQTDDVTTVFAEADVYMYYFAWNTPCGGGRLRAFHTAELPLAMRLVAHPESEQLSRQISGAWAAFARTGNPSHHRTISPSGRRRSPARRCSTWRPTS